MIKSIEEWLPGNHKFLVIWFLKFYFFLSKQTISISANLLQDFGEV